MKRFPIDHFTDCIAEQEREMAKQELMALAHEGGKYDLEFTIKPADGSPLRLTHSLGILETDAQGRKLMVLGFVEDITARRRAEVRLQLAANVFAHAREGMTVTDPDGTIIDINPAFTRITGYSREEVLGQNPRILQSGRQTKEFYVALWRDLLADGYWSGEIWNKRKNGEIYPELLTISAVTDVQGNVSQYVGLFTDITVRRQTEDKVHQLAYFDPLTQLPNRRLLMDRLAQALAANQRSAAFGALMYLDLDNFKPLNDQHGHGAGDLLLVEVARRLKACVRAVDTVSRIGGDEFVVLLVDLTTDHAHAVEQAKKLAEKIRFSLAEPYLLPVSNKSESIEHHSSASIGVVLIEPQHRSVEGLLKWVDAAMYLAKEEGRNRVNFIHERRAQQRP